MDSQTLIAKAPAAPRDRRRWIVAASLIAILAAGAFLRFYQLGQSGVNDYYAAAVKSMLLSWKNFFFVAFEPGGSLSLDKPPLGFWIEAVSAYFFGVNGWALGGFLDQYDEVSLEKFTGLVQSGRLRYVLGDALDRHQAIAQWVKKNCSVVDASAYGGSSNTAMGNFGGPGSSAVLYQCGD